MFSQGNRGLRVNSGKRYKAYQAATGVSYRYFFDSQRRVFRPEGQGTGTDYVFVVIPDQRIPFVLRIFVADRALAAWQQRHGRPLDPPEQYAAAKIRLFRGFDEQERLLESWLGLVVDERNVDDLLEPLDVA
jgi:hypothetical protein